MDFRQAAGDDFRSRLCVECGEPIAEGAPVYYRESDVRTDVVHAACHGQQYLDFDPRPGGPVDHLEQAALDFHRANPHVLREIVQACLGMRAAGYTRWSINAAFEVVRYNAALRTTGTPYKLNNSHRAYYARWIMRDVPELRGFFETREGRAA